jgi:hypothetical protein
MSIPAASLISFTASFVSNTACVEPLQDLLVASHRLDTLIFKNIPHPFNAARGRLPPIKKLLLSGIYRWLDTPEDTPKTWDFSRLEELDISWHTVVSFLESVPLKDLSRLKRLEIDDSCWDDYWQRYPGPGEHYNADATRLLRELLMLCHHFERLDIKCQLNSLDISLITSQGDSLRALRIFDFVTFETEGHVPTLSPTTDLEMLQSSCPRLTTLALGMSRIEQEVCGLFHAFLFILMWNLVKLPRLLLL